MLPLHIFEERYRLLVRERRDFGIVLIRRGSEVGSGRAADLFEVGTLATFQRVDELPGGRFAVVVRGVWRFQVQALDHSRPYLMGTVRALPDPPPAARPQLVELVERYLAAHGVPIVPRLSADIRERAVWIAGSVLQADPARRQRLLESGDPVLAEALLLEELAKLGTLGRLGTFSPRPPAPN